MANASRAALFFYTSQNIKLPRSQGSCISSSPGGVLVTSSGKNPPISYCLSHSFCLHKVLAKSVQVVLLYHQSAEVPCICLPLMSLALLCSHRSPANFLLAISNFNMGPKVVLPWRRQQKFLLPPSWECKMNMAKMCAHCQENCECFLCL